MWQTPMMIPQSEPRRFPTWLHCVLAAATGSGIIEGVKVSPNVMLIRRDPIECLGLKIDVSYPNRGRSRLLLWLRQRGCVMTTGY
jgi:hypothetical protein